MPNGVDSTQNSTSNLHDEYEQKSRIESSSGFDLEDGFDPDPYSYDSWMVASRDDPEHRRAKIVKPFELVDRRDDKIDLPNPIDSEYASIWGVNDIDDRVSISPLGIAYPAKEGTILTTAMPVATQLAWLAAAPVTTLGNPDNCPTRKPITGEDWYSTSHYKTRDEARVAADKLVKSRSKTDAGLVRNGHTCTNASCTRKRVRNLKVFRSRTTHVTVLGSVFWGDWRYYASGEYWWWGLLECY